jgi:hypothetical protein
MICGTCGSNAIRTTIHYHKGDRIETCNHCDGRSSGTSVPVDAAGQPISFPTGGFYSIALGDKYWDSKRDFVNYVQKNGFVGRPDIAMGRKNHNGFRNASASRSRR